MKATKHTLSYQNVPDYEVVEAYINKNTYYKKSQARKIKRQLRRLAFLGA